jgi:hypothetical protein
MAIEKEHKWCVYKCVHPRGFYYWGKGITQAVMKGSYKGSGTKLYAAWELGGYPKSEWTATVIETFPVEPLNDKGKDPGEAKAYAREKEIITFEMLSDPFCLNDTSGGVGGWKWRKLTKTSIKKRKDAIKAAMARPEVKEKHTFAMQRINKDPAIRAKRAASTKASWETREKLPMPKEALTAKRANEEARLLEECEKALADPCEINGLIYLSATAKKHNTKPNRLLEYIRKTGSTVVLAPPRAKYRPT